MNAPAFHPLVIAAMRVETPELTHVRLEGAPPEFLNAHNVAGQYVQVFVEDQKLGFYAIACQPGTGGIDLLVKAGNPISDYVIARKPGETVDVSVPSGKGFPLDAARAPGKDLFLVGMGSAMAPLRAVVQAVLAAPDQFGRIRFFYGARAPEWVPYRTETEGWGAAGVQFRLAQSCLDDKGALVGECVQDALATENPAQPGSVAFICGTRPMVEESTRALGRLGIPPERVFQNF
jgi:NAD(P)H-flavin reductase